MPITFKFDEGKAKQTVLWFLSRHGGSFDKLALVKLVFLADRKHLVQYGRPIVGGEYVAMPLGPVSSPLLDMIDEAGPQTGFELQRSRTVVATEPLDTEPLSESDVEVLGAVDEEYGRMSPQTLVDITHSFHAWKKNRPEPRHRNPLPYEDFFEDVADKRMLACLRDSQGARAFFE